MAEHKFRSVFNLDRTSSNNAIRFSVRLGSN